MLIGEDLSALGYIVIYIREDDFAKENVVSYLRYRASYANKKKAILYVSILGNSSEDGSNSLVVLRNTDMPSVLVAYGFIDNEGDMMYLSDERNREAIFRQITNEIISSFDLKV